MSRDSRSSSRSSSSSSRRDVHSKPVTPQRRDSPTPSTTLYVSRIPASWESADIIKILEAFTEVRSCKIVRTPSGASRGFGFVVVPSIDDAYTLMSRVKEFHRDSPLKVEFAYERRKEIDRRSHVIRPARSIGRVEKPVREDAKAEVIRGLLRFFSEDVFREMREYRGKRGGSRTH